MAKLVCVQVRFFYWSLYFVHRLMWDFQSRYIPYSFPLLHSLQLSDAAYPEFYNLVKQLEHEGGGMRDPNAKPPPPGPFSCLCSPCTPRACCLCLRVRGSKFADIWYSLFLLYCLPVRSLDGASSAWTVKRGKASSTESGSESDRTSSSGSY
jgi:hypothetical protein